MDVHKAPLLEELVDGEGRHRANTEYRGEGVGPGTQVGDGPQVLQRMALLLERIVRSRGALHFDLRGLELDGLLGLRGIDQGAGDDQRRAHILLGNVLVII